MAEAEAVDAELAAKAKAEAKTQEERDEVDIAFILKVGRRRAARLLRLRVASQEVAPGLMSKRRLPNQHRPQSRKRGPRSAEGLTKVESTSASLNSNSGGIASSTGTGCREWVKKAPDQPVDEGERSRWCNGTAGRSGRNITSTASASKWMRSTRMSQQTVSVAPPPPPPNRLPFPSHLQPPPPIVCFTSPSFTLRVHLLTAMARKKPCR
jgi:hypothetical protein